MCSGNSSGVRAVFPCTLIHQASGSIAHVEVDIAGRTACFTTNSRPRITNDDRWTSGAVITIVPQRSCSIRTESLSPNDVQFVLRVVCLAVRSFCVPCSLAYHMIGVCAAATSGQVIRNAGVSLIPPAGCTVRPGSYPVCSWVAPHIDTRGSCT